MDQEPELSITTEPIRSVADRSTFDSAPSLWGPTGGEYFSMVIFLLMSLLWGLHTIYEVVQSASEGSEKMKKDYVLSESFDSNKPSDMQMTPPLWQKVKRN